MSVRCKNTFLSFFIFLAILSHAQNKYGPYYVLNPRVVASIPHPLSNGAFKKSFTGVYDLSASLTANVYGGAEAGAHFRNSVYKIPANKIAGLGSTTMQINEIGARAAFSHFFSETVYFNTALHAGEAQVSFSSVPCKVPLYDKYKFSAFYWELETSFNFFVENNFAIGINFSYHRLDKPFDPAFICLTDYAGYQQSDYKGAMSAFNFGVSFYYGLIYRKTAPKLNISE